jgi:hypothetical protein
LKPIAPALVFLILSVSATTAQQPSLPRACGGVTVVATGGQAVAPYTPGSSNGGYIYNPLSATDQGIATAENLYLNPTAAAGTTGNGQTVALSPGQPWYIPAGVNLGSLTINAATSGHNFVCVRW